MVGTFVMFCVALAGGIVGLVTLVILAFSCNRLGQIRDAQAELLQLHRWMASSWQAAVAASHNNQGPPPVAHTPVG
jgi:hypothetical protein